MRTASAAKCRADPQCIFCHLQRRLFSPGSYGRCVGFGVSGTADRMLQRCFYQRSGYGNCGHCPWFRTGIPSGGAGTYGNHGSIFGYDPDLYPDGLGHSGKRGADSLWNGYRRYFDHPGFFFRIWREGCVPDCSSLDPVCIGNHFGMEPVRHPMRRIFVWARSLEEIPVYPDSGDAAFFGIGYGDRLVAV